ncbi:hypothetical protein V6N11_013851 [Hibiscus sabdariffa]|uniref:Uncharacterized protein n=1 Tax=Hibiscus sabdariffa TaxID=183260 RepID=A0ABR1ZN21_9ROSI
MTPREELQQGNQPLNQYIQYFCRKCEEKSELIRSGASKCWLFIKGLNRELCPFFITSKTDYFPTLVQDIRSVAATLNKPPIRRASPPEEYQREIESEASVDFPGKVLPILIRI